MTSASQNVVVQNSAIARLLLNSYNQAQKTSKTELSEWGKAEERKSQPLPQVTRAPSVAGSTAGGADVKAGSDVTVEEEGSRKWSCDSQATGPDKHSPVVSEADSAERQSVHGSPGAKLILGKRELVNCPLCDFRTNSDVALRKHHLLHRRIFSGMGSCGGQWLPSRRRTFSDTPVCLASETGATPQPDSRSPTLKDLLIGTPRPLSASSGYPMPKYAQHAGKNAVCGDVGMLHIKQENNLQSRKRDLSYSDSSSEGSTSPHQDQYADGSDDICKSESNDEVHSPGEPQVPPVGEDRNLLKSSNVSEVGFIPNVHKKTDPLHPALLEPYQKLGLSFKPQERSSNDSSNATFSSSPPDGESSDRARFEPLRKRARMKHYDLSNDESSSCQDTVMPIDLTAKDKYKHQPTETQISHETANGPQFQIDRAVQCVLLSESSVAPPGEPMERLDSEVTSSSTRYRCPYCTIMFEDEVLYSIHMGFHSHSDPFLCNMCGKLTINKYSFYTHIMRGHSMS